MRIGLIMRPTYFCLTTRPFPTTPSTQFYYPAAMHENAVELLRQTVLDGEGMATLTGDAGLGKTLVAHLLFERLGNDSNRSLLTNCRFTERADLFRAVLFDLGQTSHCQVEQELRLALTSYLLDQFANGRSTILVLDEAQGLSADILEELRLLGNLETSRGKAVQIILIGQTGLDRTLDTPSLLPLQQRLAVRAHLEPLDLHESCDYLAHQIRLAGGRPEKIMTDEAMRLVARTARGIPRLLNRYAYQALVFAEQASADRVDAEVVIETLSQLGVEPVSNDDDVISSTEDSASAEEHWADRRVETSGSTLPANLGAPHLGGRRNPIDSDAPWIAGSGVSFPPPGTP